MRLRRRPSGNVLMIVMLLLFVAVTIVLAMSTTEAVTLNQTLRGIAELEAHQAERFAVAGKLGATTHTAPSWLRVSLKVSEDSRLGADDDAKDLFQRTSDRWSGLPDLQEAKATSFDADQEGYPGHRYLSMEPGGLAAPRGSLRTVTSQDSPYAVLAGTKVDLDGVAPFENPTWGTSRDPLAEQGAVAPTVAGAESVDVRSFPVGTAYVGSANDADLELAAPATAPGPVAVALDASLARLPGGSLDTLRTTVEGQLTSAMAALAASASAADRSELLSDKLSTTESLGLFFTEYAVPSRMKDHLSLRESQSFWLPAIPGIFPQFGIMWHLVLHMPNPPDGNLTDLSQAAESMLEEVVELVQTLDWAIEQLEDAESALDKAQKDVDCDCAWYDAPCWTACGIEQAAIETAKLAVTAAEFGVTTAESALLMVVSPVTDDLEIILAAEGSMKAPTSRQDQADYHRLYGVHLDEDGMDYWSYRSVFADLGTAFSDLLSGDYDKVGKDFGNAVDLVLFGQMDKVQSWTFSGSTFTSRATWNVPRGRTFYYNGSMVVAGDLWIGRGATFVVTGDLALQAGDAGTDGGPTATGRLFLEEGASLVVDGDFTAAGTREGGSVVLGSPLGAVHEITSAVLCEGTVTLPYGVVPGVVLDELPKVVDGKPQADLVSASTALFEPLLDGIAPNLAKIDGPFHRRFPYVARYATTFEWITELDIPYVIPENFANFHVHVFRGLSALYEPTLNFELGEDLLTHSDWWGTKGEGRAALLLKPDAAEAGAALASSSFSPSLGDLADLTTELTTRSKQVGSSAVDDLANDLCLALMANWTYGISKSTKIPMVSVGMVISGVLTVVDEELYDLDTREESLDKVVPDSDWSALATAMGDFWTAVDSATAGDPMTLATLAQECPGALVYGGSGVKVTGGILASGMFVSRGDVTLESDATVGSALSTRGAVTGKSLYYYPPFTHASLFVPQAEDDDWETRAKASTYGASMSDTRATKSVSVGLWTERVTAQSWEPKGR